MVSPAPPARPVIDVATEHVLATMLRETMEIMDELSAIGDLRAATAAVNPHELAATLRAASRLARIGAWIMAQEQSLCALGAETARASLEAAHTGPLEPASRIGPIAHVQTRIDRLAARALRMDDLLRHGDVRTAPNAAPDPQRPGATAVVLPMKPRSRQLD